MATSSLPKSSQKPEKYMSSVYGNSEFSKPNNKFEFFSRLKPLYTICRSYGTLFPNKYSFVGSFLIAGLKPVVNICRSYGTLSRKKR